MLQEVGRGVSPSSFRVCSQRASGQRRIKAAQIQASKQQRV